MLEPRRLTTPWAFTAYYRDSFTYCDEMSEIGNSGIGSEVDFLGNELLRQIHNNS
jgi:hypothetical protein